MEGTAGAGQDLTREELIARARALVPFLEERAAATEDRRAMLDEVQARLAEDGMFRILQAPYLGGLGLDLTTHFEVAGILAEGCGSSAWVQCLVGYQNYLVGWYPKAVQDDVLADGRPLFAGLVMGPPVTALRTKGGVRLDGRWPYISGIDHATWLMLSAKDPDVTDGPPRVLTCLLKREEVAIDDDWYAMGLRGTGSKTAVLDDLFVPDHRVLCFRETERAGGPPGREVNSGPLFRGVANSTIFAIVIAAPAIGLAERAISAFHERLETRTNARMASSQTEWPASQARLGRARVRVDAARRALRHVAETVMELAEKLTVEERVLIRAELVEIVRACTEVVYDLFCDAGTGVTLDGSILQRCFRDIHVLRSHFMLLPDAAAENAGRVQLGMPPGPPFI